MIGAEIFHVNIMYKMGTRDPVLGHQMTQSSLRLEQSKNNDTYMSAGKRALEEPLKWWPWGFMIWRECFMQVMIDVIKCRYGSNCSQNPQEEELDFGMEKSEAVV